MLDLLKNGGNFENLGSCPLTDYVLDSLVDTKQLQEDKREKVRAALLLRHKHQSTKDHDSKLLQNIRSMADIGRYCVCSTCKYMFLNSNT